MFVNSSYGTNKLLLGLLYFSLNKFNLIKYKSASI